MKPSSAGAGHRAATGDLVEDIEFLLTHTGMDMEHLTARLGRCEQTIVRALHATGREDLLGVIRHNRRWMPGTPELEQVGARQ